MWPQLFRLGSNKHSKNSGHLKHKNLPNYVHLEWKTKIWAWFWKQFSRTRTRSHMPKQLFWTQKEFVQNRFSDEDSRFGTIIGAPILVHYGTIIGACTDSGTSPIRYRSLISGWMHPHESQRWDSGSVVSAMPMKTTFYQGKVLCVPVETLERQVLYTCVL